MHFINNILSTISNRLTKTTVNDCHQTTPKEFIENIKATEGSVTEITVTLNNKSLVVYLLYQPMEGTDKPWHMYKEPECENHLDDYASFGEASQAIAETLLTY